MELNKKDKDLVNRIRKDIFDLIKKSYNIKNVDNYNNIYADIMTYVELLTSLGIDTDDIFNYICETRKDNTFECIMKHYSESEKTLTFDNKVIENLREALINSNYFHGDFEKMETKITDKQSLEMSFDFLDNIKPSISNQLYNMLKEERIIFKQDQDLPHNGATFCSTYKFSPYVLVYLLSNIIDVSTIIHEMAHVYHYQKLQFLKYQDIYKSIYHSQMEVYSHYLELISYDYFSKFYNKKDIVNLKRTMIKNLVCFYSLLENELLDFNKVNYIDNYFDCSNYYSYGRGILLAYEFYDIYTQDKEKADYYTEQFLSETGKFDYLTIIDNYGLNREKIENCAVVKKYIKEIF